MVMSNMTTFRLSQDQTVLSVGPSYKFVISEARPIGHERTMVANGNADGVTSMDFYSQAVLRCKVVGYLQSVYLGFCSVAASVSTEMREALLAMMWSITK